MFSSLQEPQDMCLMANAGRTSISGLKGGPPNVQNPIPYITFLCFWRLIQKLCYDAPPA